MKMPPYILDIRKRSASRKIYIMQTKPITDKKKRILNIIVLLAILAVLVYSVVFLLWANTLEIYHSPMKQTTIGIDYDLVSRPVIYQKEGVVWRKIWEYEGSGLNEETAPYWFLEWIDEHTIALHYRDGDHPDENYTINL